jgi:hypothetical protein
VLVMVVVVVVVRVVVSVVQAVWTCVTSVALESGGAVVGGGIGVPGDFVVVVVPLPPPPLLPPGTSQLPKPAWHPAPQ